MIAVNVDMNRVLDLLEDYESEFNLPPMRRLSLEDRIKQVVEAARDNYELEDKNQELSIENFELKEKVDRLETDDDCDCDEEIDAMQEEIIKLEGVVESYRAQFGDLEE